MPDIFCEMPSSSSANRSLRSWLLIAVEFVRVATRFLRAGEGGVRGDFGLFLTEL